MASLHAPTLSVSCDATIKNARHSRQSRELLEVCATQIDVVYETVPGVINKCSYVQMYVRLGTSSAVCSFFFFFNTAFSAFGAATFCKNKCTLPVGLLFVAPLFQPVETITHHIIIHASANILRGQLSLQRNIYEESGVSAAGRPKTRAAIDEIIMTREFVCLVHSKERGNNVPVMYLV